MRQNQLKFITLDNNGITQIDSLYYVVFTELDRLDLSYNQITNIAFENLIMPGLGNCDLTSNQLTSVPDPCASKLWAQGQISWVLRIHMRFNPWLCDDAMLWITRNVTYEFVRGKWNVFYRPAGCRVWIDRLQDIRCAAPESLTNRSILDLVESTGGYDWCTVKSV